MCLGEQAFTLALGKPGMDALLSPAPPRRRIRCPGVRGSRRQRGAAGAGERPPAAAVRGEATAAAGAEGLSLSRVSAAKPVTICW